MTKIDLFTDSVLLKKTEAIKGEFEVTGGDPTSPMYKVAFCGPDAGVAPGDIVILKPGSYENNVIDGVTYLYAEGSQIAGKVL